MTHVRPAPIWGLVNSFNNFDYFFGKKINKIAYSHNGKDTPNIKISITSFLYKISVSELLLNMM